MGAKWVCEKCYDRLGKEYECLTLDNFVRMLCVFCDQTVGDYYVVNPPEELPHDDVTDLEGDDAGGIS